MFGNREVNKMFKFNKTSYLLVGVLFTSSVSAFAEEVIMYRDQAPSAEEMAKILFSTQGNSSRQKTKIKTRSISFSSQPQQETPAQVATTVASQSRPGIGLPVQFGYNSADMLPESISYVNEIGKMLRMDALANEKILIEGHTDAAGSPEYNRQLSRRRAEAVKGYLVKYYHVAADRLLVAGKGESSPLAGLDAYDAGNRRVEIYKAP